nr:hypothetical protein [Tanacetum cinerariifolium]
MAAHTMPSTTSWTREGYGSSIARPKIEEKDHFELKDQFLKVSRDNTFSGSDNEDANEHIKKFLEILDLFHIPNITQDQVMLRAFPMSLTGAVSRWLRNEPIGSITTWETPKENFLSKYCPPARIAKKMEEINNFQQDPYETLYQAWERFNELLLRWASVSVMPFLTYTNLGLGKLVPTKLIVKLADRTVKRPKDFAVVENMDSYRDEGMSDIIVGRPFCRDAYIKSRRFDGMITIYKENDSVTYQMARSHLRFKHLTNAKCNKMQPLLKVSAQDELKGIFHPYQKLIGFYKEVLNLGWEYIKDEKVEEWLTCGHVSVYEME